MNPHTVDVYNYCLDGYGHVNNARYLEFLEEARWDFFKKQNLNAELRQNHLVVVQMNIRYRGAAILDDQLNIFSRVLEVQSRQVKMQQRIIRVSDQTLILEAELLLVPTLAASKITRLPSELINKLKSLIK